MKKAIAYYRQASIDQDESGILEQRMAVAEFAMKNDFIIEKEFADKWVSGLTENRQGFKELIAYVEDEANQEVNAVIVYDIARIGRSIDILRNFSGILNRSNKELVIVK